MSEDILSSSTHMPAPSGIISQKKMFKDLRSEVLFGKCSACGHIDLNPKEFIQCEGGDLLCRPCKIDFNGKSYCEDHLIGLVGDKRMFFILTGIWKRIDRTAIIKAASISEEQASDAFRRLKERQYIIVKDYGRQEIRITDVGRLALDALSRTFSKYSDAAIFTAKLEAGRR